MSEEMVQDAILRNLTVIGEAVNNLSKHAPHLLEEHGHDGINWSSIVGLRDVLLHEYFTVDLRIIWAVVDKHLDVLDAVMQAMEAELNGGEAQTQPAHEDTPQE